MDTLLKLLGIINLTLLALYLCMKVPDVVINGFEHQAMTYINAGEPLDNSMQPDEADNED